MALQGMKGELGAYTRRSMSVLLTAPLCVLLPCCAGYDDKEAAEEVRSVSRAGFAPPPPLIVRKPCQRACLYTTLCILQALLCAVFACRCCSSRRSACGMVQLAHYLQFVECGCLLAMLARHGQLSRQCCRAWVYDVSQAYRPALCLHWMRRTAAAPRAATWRKPCSALVLRWLRRASLTHTPAVVH
jgi:hypothetical protein